MWDQCFAEGASLCSDSPLHCVRDGRELSQHSPFHHHPQGIKADSQTEPAFLIILFASIAIKSARSKTDAVTFSDQNNFSACTVYILELFLLEKTYSIQTNGSNVV